MCVRIRICKSLLACVWCMLGRISLFRVCTRIVYCMRALHLEYEVYAATAAIHSGAQFYAEQQS